MTRDSVVWWLALAAVVVGYLMSAQRAPIEWSYNDWLQFAAAVLGWVIGKLQSSPLKGGAQ